LISVWHPTFLSLLVEPLAEMFPGESDPAALHARLWPRLRVISCWADAAAAQPAAELARLFPHARIQPKGLIATEAFVSLPLEEHDGAALAVRSHFFEFVDDCGHVRLAHQLSRGDEVSVVVTTGGGLLRYRLRDRVAVTGFVRECPVLRFIGKEALVSDWFGEKLSELQVQRALDASGLEVGFALVACEDNGYVLFAETPVDGDRLLEAAKRFDAALRDNIHYRYCRQLGQLRPLRVCRLRHGGREAWLRECAVRGQRLGGVKPSLLRRDTDWMAVFTRAGVVAETVRFVPTPAFG
jgi:hypothetical protein